jgi:hypothetical protein
MLTGLPAYITITFLLTVILTWLLFINATTNKKAVSTIIIVWLTITGLLAYNNFFTDTSGMPPKFTLAIAPAVILIIALLISRKGQRFTDRLDLRKLTILHVIRVPVEITLYWLAAEKAVPELMTFAGRNFDILSGISSILIYFVCFKGSQVKNRGLLLVWNFICLGLLLNIVINALLSAPFSFQQFAFHQPNIAVLYFPFVWLPSFIVMVVLLSHLVTIRRLLKR